jgi:ferredoxin-type protein NapF
MSSRRDFFSFLRSEQKGVKPLHAPYFNILKKDICLACETSSCISACTEKILKVSADKTPILDFANSGCTFCNDCANACEYSVMDGTDKIAANFEIAPLSCLAWNKTMCMSCLDVCNEKAIKFSALFYPKIELASCTACGFCISRCPSNAITYKEQI